LLEFSQPAIISEISSGQLNKSLDVMGKSAFIVDRETMYILCKLIINLIDYEDEIEMLVWVEIDGKEYLSKFEHIKEIDEMIVIGNLCHEIPFYKESKKIPIEVHFDLNGKFHDLPTIITIGIDHRLKEDIENGIDLKEYQTRLSKLYHELD